MQLLIDSPKEQLWVFDQQDTGDSALDVKGNLRAFAIQTVLKHLLKKNGFGKISFENIDFSKTKSRPAIKLKRKTVNKQLNKFIKQLQLSVSYQFDKIAIFIVHKRR